jgi:hypothetical protein
MMDVEGKMRRKKLGLGMNVVVNRLNFIDKNLNWKWPIRVKGNERVSRGWKRIRILTW